MQLSHIIPLLKALYERISTRSATNVKPWLLWIQCILSLHASYLSSVKNLETQLGGLLEWMRVRIGHQQKLLELYGKLSMLGEQIERRINRTVIVAPQPLMVFNDDVSDLEDVESGGSDESCVSSDDEQQEWWDENGFGVNNDCRDDEDSDGLFTHLCHFTFQIHIKERKKFFEESGSDSDSNVLMSKVNNDGDNCVVNDDNELEKELSADGDDEENEDEMDIG
ncbi:NUC189 domain protein [Dictyocaulus viviparus]|uniref:NUC189 domain protein n=1 Tax=Dictyocaulus viviparus TaxID=29172 RepID=A0A0D8XEK2_DICVI|nr:NUC189 domain protein [Dictyocaulus viviparus]